MPNATVRANARTLPEEASPSPDLAVDLYPKLLGASVYAPQPQTRLGRTLAPLPSLLTRAGIFLWGGLKEE
jgi:hypothetical protein